jgi:alpha-galactosidase
MKRCVLVSGLILMMGFGWMSGPLVWAERDQPLPKDALSPTPPMGWNAWNCFGPNIDQEKIMAIADAMVASGMRDAGYQYVVIDDAWELGRVKGFEFMKVQEIPGRDENGVILVDTKKFPQGLKFLSDYLHKNGLKFGIYTGPGTATCQSCTASGGFEQSDINSFAGWGVDYIKLDWCVCSKGAQEVLPLWRTLLDECGRPIVLSVNAGTDHTYLKTVANMWRTTSDIMPHWIWKKGEFRLMMSVVNILDCQVGLDKFHGPGHWCDPDMLQVGNGNLTEDENRSHFSMWCLLAAPLMAGNDLRSMSESTRAILTNREVIAVDQDPAGQMGQRVRIIKPGLEIWAKRLQPYAAQAVVLLNRTEQAQEMTVDLMDLGIKGSAFVRDLWLHQDLGLVTKSFSAKVASHGCVMVKMQAFEKLGSYPEPEDVTTVNEGICQAEQANVEGGMTDDKNAGFTGTGYAMAQVHEWRSFFMKWVVYCRQDRMCKVQIRYANGSSKDSPFSINIPGVLGQNFTGSPTGSWETWKTIEFQVPFKQGYNHIDLSVAKPDLNNLAIDYLKISPA